MTLLYINLSISLLLPYPLSGSKTIITRLLPPNNFKSMCAMSMEHTITTAPSCVVQHYAEKRIYSYLKDMIYYYKSVCYLSCIFIHYSQKNTIPVIYENIKRGVYSFSSPIWDTISAEAKNLVTLMLQYSPNKRCSAEEMLRHPWLRVSLILQ